MDIEAIIPYIAGLLGTGGLGGLIGWRLKKRRDLAEVKKDEIDNLRATIESVYGPIVKQLQQRLADVEAENEAKVKDLQREIARLVRENNRLKEEVYELRTGQKATIRAIQAKEQKRNAKGTFIKEGGPDET